jgi:predicted secreted protein
LETLPSRKSNTLIAKYFIKSYLYHWTVINNNIGTIKSHTSVTEVYKNTCEQLYFCLDIQNIKNSEYS